MRSENDKKILENSRETRISLVSAVSIDQYFMIEYALYDTPGICCDRLNNEFIHYQLPIIYKYFDIYYLSIVEQPARCDVVNLQRFELILI